MTVILCLQNRTTNTTIYDLYYRFEVNRGSIESKLNNTNCSQDKKFFNTITFLVFSRNILST